MVVASTPVPSASVTDVRLPWASNPYSVTVPAAGRETEPYWHREGEAGRYVFDQDVPFGVPFRPTPFRAHFTFKIGGVRSGSNRTYVHSIRDRFGRLTGHGVPAFDSCCRSRAPLGRG